MWRVTFQNDNGGYSLPCKALTLNKIKHPVHLSSVNDKRLLCMICKSGFLEVENEQLPYLLHISVLNISSV